MARECIGWYKEVCIGPFEGWILYAPVYKDRYKTVTAAVTHSKQGLREPLPGLPNAAFYAELAHLKMTNCVDLNNVEMAQYVLEEDCVYVKKEIPLD